MYFYFCVKNWIDGCKLGLIYVNVINRRRENDFEIKYVFLYVNSLGWRCGSNLFSNCKILRFKNSYWYSESFIKGLLLKN